MVVLDDVVVVVLDVVVSGILKTLKICARIDCFFRHADDTLTLAAQGTLLPFLSLIGVTHNITKRVLLPRYFEAIFQTYNQCDQIGQFIGLWTSF